MRCCLIYELVWCSDTITYNRDSDLAGNCPECREHAPRGTLPAELTSVL